MITRAICAALLLIIGGFGGYAAAHAVGTSVDPASMAASTDCVNATFEGASGGADFYPLAHLVEVEPLAGGGCVLRTTTSYVMRDQRIVRLPVGLR